MKRRGLTVALSLALSVLPASAQFYNWGSEPAGIRWYQLTTPDYNVLYPEGLDSLARVYARLLEQVKEPVGATAGFTPNQMYRKQLPVVLHPWEVSSNGMVAWTPKRMELLTTPLARHPLPHSWEEHLVVHESRHVAQMQYVAAPPYKFWNVLIGQLSAGALSALYCGPAFDEGDAVVAETELSRSGRGRSASFLEYYRVAFGEGDYRDWGRWRYGSVRHYTPNYYAAGYIRAAGMRSLYDAPDFTARYFERLFRSKAWPFPFFNYPATVREVSGKKFKEAFREISDTLRVRWRRDEVARGPFMTLRRISEEPSRFTEYESSFYLGGLLYSIRKGMSEMPHLVRREAGGNIRTVALWSSSVSRLKPCEATGRFYWSETVRDLRWDFKSWSEIRYSGPDGRKHRLSSRTRWFNPSPSPDGSRLSVSEYPVEGGSALLEIDAVSGEVLSRYEAPAGMQVLESEWKDGGLVVSALTGAGMGIYKVGTGGFELLLDCGHAAVEDLFCREGKLYFSSDLGGVCELYRFDEAGRCAWRITNSIQGASSYCFAPDGLSLVCSVLRPGGRVLCEMPVSGLPEPTRADFSTPHRYEFADDLTAGGPGVPDTGVEVQLPEPQRYSRLGHLIRFHSWAPLYVDYDAIETMSFESITSAAGLGATAFFQNDLGTMTGTVAYNAGYADKKWTHKAETKFTYSGFYPVIEADFEIDSGNPSLYYLKSYYSRFAHRISFTRDPIDNYPSFSGSLLAYVPFKFSSGGWSRGFIPQLRWTFTNSLVTRGNLALMNRLSASVRGYCVQGVPQSRIYPKWGFGLEAGWSGRPGGMSIFNPNAYVYGYGYLPGFMDTHGWRVSATLQKPLGEALFNERFIAVMPRGMGAYSELASTLANYPFQGRLCLDYAFPFAPLDWSGLGPVAYVRNFECTLHGDLSRFWGTGSAQNLSSIGADLCVVLGNLLWVPLDTRIGVSYYYNLGIPSNLNPHSVGMVFNVSF
ncbi:MAG: hypothetical protein IJP55_05090 [Bacteroidales bacterium]|nr:hypothetical protein [Bacteroidales bacterium]